MKQEQFASRPTLFPVMRAICISIFAAVIALFGGCKKKQDFSTSFGVACVEVETGIMTAKFTLDIVRLAGSSVLDEEKTDAKTGKKESMRQTAKTERARIEKEIRSLNPPPSEHHDAYEKLRALFVIYDKYASRLLDSKNPEPFSKLEDAMLKEQVERLKSELKVIMPVKK